MTQRGRLESINISGGGVPKMTVTQARVTAPGIDGDAQRDLRYHGGPDRAVSIYSMDRIEALRLEGHPIAPGTAGENLTVSGIDWSFVTPGVEMMIGGVRLLVTRYAAPCSNIRHAFADEDFTRISQKIHPGWSRVYTRVLEAGTVRRGDTVEVVRRQF